MRMTIGMLRQIIKEEVIRDMRARRVDEGFMDSIKGAFGATTGDDKTRAEENKKSMDNFKADLQKALDDYEGSTPRKWSNHIDNPGKHWLFSPFEVIGRLDRIIIDQETQDRNAKMDRRNAQLFTIRDRVLDSMRRSLGEYNSRLQSALRDMDQVRQISSELGGSDASHTGEVLNSWNRVTQKLLKVIDGYQKSKAETLAKYPAKNDAKSEKTYWDDERPSK